MDRRPVTVITGAGNRQVSNRYLSICSAASGLNVQPAISTSPRCRISVLVSWFAINWSNAARSTPSPLIVIATQQVARAIALEATLSFLGLGVPITEPSLGLLIANGYQYMLSGKYWISFYPGIALLLTIVSINLVGDQLRDVLNPRLKR